MRDNPLSPRECQILELITQGYTQQQIANKFGTAFDTVKNQLYYARQKIGSHSTINLVIEAIRQGWIEVDGIQPTNGRKGTNNDRP